MKLHPILKSEVEKINNLGAVLDLGFGYPYKLIELFHICGAYKCYGVDLEEEQTLVSCSFVSNEISENGILEIDRYKIDDLIRDSDFKREFHNSYKLYTSLVLDKEEESDGNIKNGIIKGYSNEITSDITGRSIKDIQRIRKEIDDKVKE